LELYRPATVLGTMQTEMNLHFTENGKALPLETVVWDDDLNTGLIHLGVRSVTPEQEAERFALGLRDALRKAEREGGNGYLNAVLLAFISDSELVRYPEIAEVLEHAYGTRLNHEGNGADRYNLCREMIANAISGRARELTDRLNYPQEEAKRILVAALT